MPILRISTKKVNTSSLNPKAMASGWETVEVGSWRELAGVVCRDAWSPCVWDGGRRLKSRFREAGLIVLDFDSGMRIEAAEAAVCAAGWRNIIGTTKSHSAAAHRFRVILQPSTMLPKNAAEYSAVMAAVMRAWPAADLACKDAARYFWPCREIVNIGDGRSYPVPKVYGNTDNMRIKHWKREAAVVDAGFFPHGKTRDFLTIGVGCGQRRPAIFRAAADLARMGFADEQIIAAIKRSPIDWKGLDEDDTERQIRNGISQGRIDRGAARKA